MFNRYAYAANDPVNMIDPDGEIAVPLIVPLVVVGGGAVLTDWYVNDRGGKIARAITGLISRNDNASGTQIHEGKQGKHVPGHRNFQPGRSEVDHPDLQGLVDENAGTGEQIGDTPVGEPGSKERVDFGEPIGTHVTKDTGERSETSVGIIHYSKKGVHVVPARPNPPDREQQ